MDLGGFQATIARTYGDRDRARGIDGTFRWFVEEVGELAKALRRHDTAELALEFSDVLAWLVSLGSLTGVDIAEAAQRYAHGCPKCHQAPCSCPRT